MAGLIIVVALQLFGAIPNSLASKEAWLDNVQEKIDHLEKQDAGLVAMTFRQQQMLEEQASQSERTNDLVRELRELVLAQASEIESQRDKVKELDSHVEKLSTVLKKREDLVSILTAGISAVRGDLKDCIESKKELSTGNTNKPASTESSETTQTATNTASRRFLNEGPFAFQAVSDRPEIAHISPGQAIIFENVLTNIGRAFHTNHSLFIAEIPGIYLFSASILTYVNTQSEYSAALVKNGINLALLYGHGDSGRHDQGSVTVVTQLNVGDEVWVKHLTPNDGSIYGGRYTTFSGVLVYML